MTTETTTDNDVRFAVETRIFDGAWPKKMKNGYAARTMPYKACAAYAATVIRNPENYRYNFDGSVRWVVENLEILNSKMPIIDLGGVGGGVRYYPDYLYPEIYGPAMYIVTAMQNAVSEIKAEAAREMTTAEIEAEFGLKRGVVRKYIHDHIENLIEIGAIRKADKRTWLCKRGWAKNVWVQRVRGH